MCLQTHLLPRVCFEIWRQLWHIIQTFTHLRFTGEESSAVLSERVGGNRYGYCTLQITVMREHINIIWQEHLSFFLILIPRSFESGSGRRRIGNESATLQC